MDARECRHLFHWNDSRYQDRLSNYDEIEWYQFQQLSEVILIQENGPREAVEAVRKRLKHGTTQQKIRVLEVCRYAFQVKLVGQLANSFSRRSSNYSWRTVISGSIVSEAFHLIVWFRLETHRDACPRSLRSADIQRKDARTYRDHNHQSRKHDASVLNLLTIQYINDSL